MPIPYIWIRNTIIHTCITTALHAEARPLIDHFGLKQDTTIHAVPVYRSDAVSLAVGGIGKIKASVATTCLLSQIRDYQQTIALNVGIAGCSQDAGSNDLQIGDLFLICKIIDFATERESYPDILIDCSVQETTLTTVDKPLDKTDGIDVADGLVDMEASGYYQAAATFLSPHQIGCIKVISDFLEVERFDRDWVSDLIGRHIQTIDDIITRYQAITDRTFDILHPDDLTMLTGIRQSLHLTVSQYKHLTDWARAYKLHTECPLPDLSEFIQTNVTDKYEGKKYLEQLRERLLAP